jgi:V-type H+-transporting ATPase subunit A
MCRAKEVLAQQDALQEIVQLVGRESLSEDQKVVLDVADIIVSDFLYQSAFTNYDYVCPLTKSVSILSVIVFFISLYSYAVLLFFDCYIYYIYQHFYICYIYL